MRFLGRFGLIVAFLPAAVMSGALILLGPDLLAIFAGAAAAAGISVWWADYVCKKVGRTSAKSTFIAMFGTIWLVGAMMLSLLPTQSGRKNGMVILCLTGMASMALRAFFEGLDLADESNRHWRFEFALMMGSTTLLSGLAYAVPIFWLRFLVIIPSIVMAFRAIRCCGAQVSAKDLRDR